MSLATAQDDWDTAPVEQLIDDDPHTRIPADPTAWFPALEVSTHWLSHPRYRANQKVVVAQRGLTQNVQRTATAGRTLGTLQHFANLTRCHRTIGHPQIMDDPG